MSKTTTTKYDVAEHLQTPEEMAITWKPALKNRRATLPLSLKLLETLPVQKA